MKYIISWSSLHSTKVVYDAQIKTTKLDNILVDEQKGIVVALCAQGLYVTLQDVQKWPTKETLIIQLTHNTTPLTLSEFPQGQNILRRRSPVLWSSVYHQGIYIGRVRDISFCYLTGAVQHIKVQRGFWWWKRRYTVAWSAVERVDTTGIFITSYTLHKESTPSYVTTEASSLHPACIHSNASNTIS